MTARDPEEPGPPPSRRLSRDERDLRDRIIRSLERQGFSLIDGQVIPPASGDKASMRAMHSEAVEHRMAKAKPGLARHESRLLSRIANGSEVVPTRINPRLIEVQRDSEDELLFRYASLHWSIPVSSGYGRRLRFLVVDEQNEKLIGVIGLGDPVMNLGPRDEFIGWKRETRHDRLHHVMDAFVLGAVPPYSVLLAGKLVAMLCASNEVRAAFVSKYACRLSRISQRSLGSGLAAVTTMSALGRSSIYNRLRDDAGRKLLVSLGYTSGYGEFHFVNGLYGALQEQARTRAVPTAKAAAWGTGFRNRREVIKKGLVSLGLPTDLIRHGIRREIFISAHGENAAAFLRGEDSELRPFDRPVEDLTAWFIERWLLPRPERWQAAASFQREDYALWSPQ